MAGNAWRVGELAGAAGLTVRALHHYDAVGLLKPSARTEAGHRLYTNRDITRLYQVLALRELGLTLGQVSTVLDQPDGDLSAIVAGQLKHVERNIERQSVLHTRLHSILDALERSEPPSADSLINVLEAMKMFEGYYTAEQLAQLEERRQTLGDDAIERAEQQWASLIAEAEAARSAGLDPASAPVLELARRWKDLDSQFTGGDTGIRQSLQRMYETEGVERASRGGVSAELMAYIGRAIVAGGGW